MAWTAKFKQVVRQGSQAPFDQLKIEVDFIESATKETFSKEYMVSVDEIEDVSDIKKLVDHDLFMIGKVKRIQQELEALTYEPKQRPKPIAE